jgi:hypothetical protein
MTSHPTPLTPFWQYNFSPNRERPDTPTAPFRFDPPILFISLVHKDHDSQIADRIYNSLVGRYVGNQGFVRFPASMGRCSLR